VSSFEKLFSVLFFLVGTGIFATVIVYVQDVVAQLDVTASISKSRCASLKRFLLREGVSTEFREQCFSHLERQWCLFRGISGVELSKYFPANLYADAVHLSVKAKLDELFYVSKRSQDFKKAFASKLTARQYAKGDFIFRGGEICNTLFVLISGEIALVADDEIFEVSNLVNLRLAAVSNAKKGSRRPSKARLSIIGGSSHPPGITETPLQHNRFTRTASKLLTAVASKISFSHRHEDDGSHAQSSPDVFVGDEQLHPGASTPNLLRAQSHQIHTHHAPSVHPAYANIVDGAIGEYEFFTRSYFACGASATKETLVFEINYEDFQALLEENDLESNFLEALSANLKVLYSASTEGAVRKVSDNLLASNKIMKMLASSLPCEEEAHVFHPHCAFVNWWELLTLLWMIYVAFTVPYCIAFHFSWGLVGLDVMFTVCMAINIYLRLNKIAIMDEGQLIEDPELFSSHYLHQFFVTDAFLCLPIALILVAATRNQTVFAWCRCISLIMLRNFSVNTNRNVDTVERLFKIQISVDHSKVLKCLCIVWFLGHCSSCCMCLIGLREAASGHMSWVTENEFNLLSPFQLYLTGYYWAIYTIVTIGYGNIALPSCNERVFAIVVMILGSVLCNAGVAAVFSTIISESDSMNGVAR
jgi:CRP-like cAMP-binding protein